MNDMMLRELLHHALTSEGGTVGARLQVGDRIVTIELSVLDVSDPGAELDDEVDLTKLD